LASVAINPLKGNYVVAVRGIRFSHVDLVVEELNQIAVTERGTPVYLIKGVPEDVVPESFRRRGRGQPSPTGPFAMWLGSIIPRGTCAVVHYQKPPPSRSTIIRIFKVGKAGDVFKITARSIRLADRKRLVASGILNQS
jgi:hypothetical protein